MWWLMAATRDKCGSLYSPCDGSYIVSYILTFASTSASIAQSAPAMQTSPLEGHTPLLSSVSSLIDQSSYDDFIIRSAGATLPMSVCTGWGGEGRKGARGGQAEFHRWRRRGGEGTGAVVDGCWVLVIEEPWARTRERGGARRRWYEHMNV